MRKMRSFSKDFDTCSPHLLLQIHMVCNKRLNFSQAAFHVKLASKKWILDSVGVRNNDGQDIKLKGK